MNSYYSVAETTGATRAERAESQRIASEVTGSRLAENYWPVAELALRRIVAGR